MGYPYIYISPGSGWAKKNVLKYGWSLFYGTERNGTEQFRHIIPRNGTIDACMLRSNRWPHTDLDSCWVLPGEESVYKQYSNVTNKNYSCFPANQVSSDSW